MPKIHHQQTGASKLRNEPATTASQKSPTRRQTSKSPPRNPTFSPSRTKFTSFRETIAMDLEDESHSPPKVRKVDESLASSSSSHTPPRQVSFYHFFKLNAQYIFRLHDCYFLQNELLLEKKML